MKKIIFVVLLLFCANVFSPVFAAVGQERGTALIKAVPFTDVEITDSFWAPRIERNRTVSIPNMLRVYGESNSIPDTTFLEAAAYLLAKYPDKNLEQQVESMLGRAAEEFLSSEPGKKWRNLLNGELYSAGHFFEATVAFYEATGNKKVLDTAVEIADDIDSVFGPGKRQDVSGHEEVKIGLLKLYHLTGNEKYYRLAKFFLDERGDSSSGRRLYGEYAQDHEPVVRQSEAVGHCVRAMYLYTPLTEIAGLSGDAAYAKATEKIWQDAVSKKMYITGNFGSHRDFEDFGDPYELPNLSCWNETCSAVGNIFWEEKLFLLKGDAKYIDILERCLYNGFLAAVSLDGERYFYQNVLQTFGDFERHPWFGPNCCPPNLARVLASLGGYIYAQTDDSIYVNLYIAGSARIKLGENVFLIKQETQYPWDGKIKIRIEPQQPSQCTLNLRIPCWAQNKPVPTDLYRYLYVPKEELVLKVNGEQIRIKPDRGFAVITRRWQKGDVIELDLSMPVRKVIADKQVLDDRGRVSLERGPIVYCVESMDNNGNVFDKYIADDAVLRSKYQDILGGVVVIKGKAVLVYRGKEPALVEQKQTELLAVPYYAWANRGKGQMTVWLAREKSKVFLPPLPTIASTSRLSSSCGQGTIQDNYPTPDVPTVEKRFYPSSQSGAGSLSSICDQIEPVSSADGTCPYLRLRPRQGDHAWVQYDFREKTKVSSAEVYWKDDKEYCILPKTWQILYWDGDEWRSVKNKTFYEVEKDKFNKMTFEPVETEKLRLQMQLNGQKHLYLGPPDANYLKEPVVWYECGILEWRVK